MRFPRISPIPLLARRAASTTTNLGVLSNEHVHKATHAFSVPAPRIKAYRAAAGLQPSSKWSSFDQIGLPASCPIRDRIADISDWQPRARRRDCGASSKCPRETSVSAADINLGATFRSGHQPSDGRRAPLVFPWSGVQHLHLRPWCGSGQCGSSVGYLRYWPPTWPAIRGSCTMTKRLHTPN